VLPERQLGEAAVVDEKLGYPAKLHSTLVDDQRAASSATLQQALTTRVPKRVGAEFATFSPHLTFLTSLGGSEFADVGPTVSRLRRHKDPDELVMLHRANDANCAMYARAREMVRPGVNEIDVYNELAAVAVRTLGEPLTYLGQDYRSGARGGAPRNRAIEAGEMYIFDLGVGFRGYYSDNARTLAVGGEPTELQQKAWQAVSSVFPYIEANVQPGVSCKMLFEAVQRELDAYQPRRRPLAAGGPASESEMGRPLRRGRLHRGRAGTVSRRVALRRAAGAELSGDGDGRGAADALAAGVGLASRIRGGP